MINEMNEKIIKIKIKKQDITYFQSNLFKALSKIDSEKISHNKFIRIWQSSKFRTISHATYIDGTEHNEYCKELDFGDLEIIILVLEHFADEHYQILSRGEHFKEEIWEKVRKLGRAVFDYNITITFRSPNKVKLKNLYSELSKIFKIK